MRMEKKKKFQEQIYSNCIYINKKPSTLSVLGFFYFTKDLIIL